MKTTRLLALALVIAAFPAFADEKSEKGPKRQQFTMFGFKIEADKIDLNLGEAKGNVVVTGEVMDAPIRIEAGALKVNLAEQSVAISGWPKVFTQGAGMKATSEKTKVKLTKQTYTVEGPATFTVDLKGLKQKTRKSSP